MKKFSLSVWLAGLVAVCQPLAEDPQTPVAQKTYSTRQIDEFIYEKLRQEGRFEWSTAPDDLAWSAYEQSDRVLSVGYRPMGTTGDFRDQIDRIDLQSPVWKDARERVLDLMLTAERKLRPDLKASDLEVFEESHLPYLTVTIKNPEAFRQLRQSPLVRYAEPIGYEPGAAERNFRVASSSGGGSNTPEPDLVAGRVAPTARRSAWPTTPASSSPARRPTWSSTKAARCRAFPRPSGRRATTPAYASSA